MVIRDIYMLSCRNKKGDVFIMTIDEYWEKATADERKRIMLNYLIANPIILIKIKKCKTRDEKIEATRKYFEVMGKEKAENYI